MGVIVSKIRPDQCDPVRWIRPVMTSYDFLVALYITPAGYIIDDKAKGHMLQVATLLSWQRLGKCGGKSSIYFHGWFSHINFPTCHGHHCQRRSSDMVKSHDITTTVPDTNRDQQILWLEEDRSFDTDWYWSSLLPRGWSLARIWRRRHARGVWTP